MWTEQTNEWLEENHGAWGREYERVLYTKQDVNLDESDFAKLFADAAVCVVIDGDLTIEGLLSLDESDGLYVSGTTECAALYVLEAAVQTDGIEATRWAQFAGSPADCIEFMDIGTLTAPVVIGDPGDFEAVCSGVECEYIGMVDEEEAALFTRILDVNFDKAYEELKAHGEAEIDGDWVEAHKDLAST